MSRVRPAALTVLVALAAAVLAAGLLAAPAGAAAPVPADLPAAVTALPHTSGDAGQVADLWTPATDPASRAVAAACTGGRQIAAPHRAVLAPATTTTVLARTEPTVTSGRTRSALPGGLALLDRADGHVLACATGTGLVQLTRRVGQEGALVVAFALAQPRPSDEDAAVVGADERELPLYLAATTGVAPGNDALGAPTRIGALPYTSTVDRYLATEQAGDLGWVGGNACGSSVGGLLQVRRSVWYSFVLAEDAVLGPSGPVDGPALALTGATQVGELTADGPVALDCAQPGADGYRLTAGRTYVVQVAEEVDAYGLPDGPVDQGTPRALALTGTARLQPAPGALTAAAPRVAPTAALDARTGSATATGTLTCTGGATGTARLTGALAQSGRTAAVDSALAVGCDGTPQAFSAVLRPAAGRLHPGSATLRLQVALTTPDGAATSLAVSSGLRVRAPGR